VIPPRYGGIVFHRGKGQRRRGRGRGLGPNPFSNTKLEKARKCEGWEEDHMENQENHK